MTTPRYILLHNTEVSYKANPNQWEATNNYHKQLFNFKSSLGFYGGYNYEIAKDGSVKQFRADGELTAAALLHNSDSIHIALDGNFDVELPTDEQIKAVTTLIKEKMVKFSIPASNVLPHRYFATTSIRDGKFTKNTTKYKTWDGCAPYKTCPGALLPDNWGMLLVAPPPQVVSVEDVTTAISILDRIKQLLLNYLTQRKALGAPAHERFEAI
jgi:hypothetical protein